MRTVEKSDRATDTTVTCSNNGLLTLEFTGSLVWLSVSGNITERWRIELLLRAREILVEDGVFEATLELFWDLRHSGEDGMFRVAESEEEVRYYKGGEGTT